MRLIVAGGRDYDLGQAGRRFLDAFSEHHGVEALLTGGASGADRGAEEWARDRGIPVEVYKPAWETHGKAAGPRRNRQMAASGDALVAFPGGRGTASMVAEARRALLPVYFFPAPAPEGE